MRCLEPNTVLAFVDGRLKPDALSIAEQHLAGCQSCADLVAAAGGATPAIPAPLRLENGTSVGRYVILDLVGRGGMGEVYAAYDPQLDRKVALKLLHGRALSGASVETARARLLREAKAIARLSHANVVVVYDAGEIEGRVYLAMEFVEGQTLAAWLEAAPKTWREVRDVFVAAGRGLAAAHQADLVHRDFKPQNVMVGRDGSVRVMDFGLASDRARANSNAALGTIALARADLLAAQSIGLTQTGMLLGTPLYMAPEQFLGRNTDPRTDQFSFCVALYHALYGERPFPTDSHASLVAAVTTGRVREPPQKTRVPPFLRQALMRGLRPDPGQRFESMAALLSALQRDPARRRRKLAIGAAALLTLAMVATGVRVASTRGQRLCQGAAERLTGVWEPMADGPRRNGVHRAFSATGRSFAEETWQRVSRLIDDWSHRWTGMYTDACEAAHVRGDQSTEVLDLRMTCLEAARRGLLSLTNVLSRADANTLIHAVNGAQELPDIDRCANVQLLKAVVIPPTDPSTRVRVDELRTRLAELKALSDTGQLEEARRKASPLLADARATGYLPVHAEALEAVGTMNALLFDFVAAAKLLEEGVWVALSAHRDDLAVRCAGVLAGLAGPEQHDPVQGRRWGRLGQSLLDRLGPGQELTAAWLATGVGLVEYSAGNLSASLEQLRAGLALKQKVLPPEHADIARSWYTIANVMNEAGDYEGALKAVEEAIRILERAFGRTNPLLAPALNNRGEILAHLGRHAEAEHDLRDSLARLGEYVPADHEMVAYPLTGLGITLLATDRPGQAVPLLERALGIRERGKDAVELADTRFALARALWETRSEKARVRTLALAARDTYLKSPAHSAQAAKVGDWLALHRHDAKARPATVSARPSLP